MSLEQALAENTAAVKELIAELKASAEGRAAALEAAKELANTGGATTTRTRKPKDNPAGEGNSSGGDAGNQTPAAPTITIEQVRAKAGEFLGIDKEDPRLDGRKAVIKGLIEKYKVAKLVDIPATGFQDVLDTIANFQDAEPAAAEDDMLG